MQVSVADAKNKLPELIKAVEDGRPVTICRRLKGKIQVLDPDWWKPMTADEVEEFLAGRG